MCIDEGDLEHAKQCLRIAIAVSFRERTKKRPNHSAPLTPEIKASMRQMALDNPDLGLEIIARRHNQNIGRAYEAVYGKR
jgi:hypothetical protein